MAVTGKMTVDLYGNTHPFVQSMKAADDAAKKSGGSIGESIDKINKKQIKNLSHEILGGLGVIGMADAGAKMALEMIKGFKDGSEKGLNGAMEIIGNSLIATIKSIPIAGTFFEIGKSIGEWASGVDAANESIARSNEQMKRTTDIVTKLKALQSPSTALTNQETKNANFGKSADVLAQEQALAEKSKQAQDLYDLQKINAAKQTTDRMADYDMKANERKNNSGRTTGRWNFEAEAKKRNEFEEKLGQQQENQLVALKNQYDEELKLADAEVEKLKAEQDIGNQNNKNAQESKQNDADLIAAQSALSQLEMEAHKIGMSARDIELERLANMKGMDDTMLSQAMHTWDQLQASKARIDAEKQLAETKAKAHEDDVKNFDKAQEQQNKAAEDYKTALEENKQQAAMASTNTDVSTALGSIKVAGTSTMNTQKIAEDSLSVQRKQLDEAIKLTGQFKQLMGAP